MTHMLFLVMAARRPGPIARSTRRTATLSFPGRRSRPHGSPGTGPSPKGRTLNHPKSRRLVVTSLFFFFFHPHLVGPFAGLPTARRRLSCRCLTTHGTPLISCRCVRHRFLRPLPCFFATEAADAHNRIAALSYTSTFYLESLDTWLRKALFLLPPVRAETSPLCSVFAPISACRKS